AIVARRMLLPGQAVVRAVVIRCARRPLPDRGERDDHRDDEDAHHGVLEHRERIERLAALLDVVLVARELRAPLVERRRLACCHYSEPPPPRATGRVSPTRRSFGSGSRSLPAASFAHGGALPP